MIQIFIRMWRIKNRMHNNSHFPGRAAPIILNHKNWKTKTSVPVDDEDEGENVVKVLKLENITSRAVSSAKHFRVKTEEFRILFWSIENERQIHREKLS